MIPECVYQHCDHAAWPVDAHEDGDDRMNGRKRRKPARTQPRLDAILRNHYHGDIEDYKKLEYPFWHGREQYFGDGIQSMYCTEFQS